MRVIVVGAGIMGLATAWALTKRGHAVTLLERGADIPNPLSASGDHHRMIRRAYGGADGYARLISEAFDAWEAMWLDLGARHYANRGVLALSQGPGDGGEVFREGLERTRTSYRLFDPAEAVRIWPFLDPATFRYAYVTEEGGALLCRRIAAGLKDWLARNGADVRAGTSVRAIDPEAGRLTTETGEEMRADVVVVTAGAWTLRLFPELADVLTLYRTAVVYVEPPADLAAAWENAPAILDIGGPNDAWVLPPVGEAGLKFGAGIHRRRTGNPDADRIPEPGEGERLRDLFSPPLSRIRDYRVASVVTCAYAFTADERFLAKQFGRVLVVSACSGHGYKFGAAVGRRVADAVETGDSETLLRWLRAEGMEPAGARA